MLKFSICSSMWCGPPYLSIAQKSSLLATGIARNKDDTVSPNSRAQQCLSTNAGTLPSTPFLRYVFSFHSNHCQIIEGATSRAGRGLKQPTWIFKSSRSSRLIYGVGTPRRESSRLAQTGKQSRNKDYSGMWTSLQMRNISTWNPFDTRVCIHITRYPQMLT